MNKDNLFQIFINIKNKECLEVIDTHIHPFDVLDIGRTLYRKKNGDIKIPKPSLLEHLEFSNTALRILKALFYLAPNLIRKNISDNFDTASEEMLLSEMREAAIDKGVLVPVEPFVRGSYISQYYKSLQFIRIGSIDIHNIAYEDIEENINDQIKKFGIVGLKLHPNIQNFYPHPSMNNPNVARKLMRIYKLAEEKRIYLLFHGGISYLFRERGKKVEYAKLENFFDKDWKSDVFQCNIPIIIAHFGNYNTIHPNFQLLRLISKNYKNIFFDTSGVSPSLIKKGTEAVGLDRVVFGSDTFYFRMKFNLQLVLKALAVADIKENFTERVIKVFGQNYKEKILKFL